MRSKKNATAGIVVIGNEVLSGRTKDKNIGWLAEQLDTLGIQLCEARIIPDIREVIIETVRRMSCKYDLLFTTGGIGPTHDDITTECVAETFGVKLIRHPEAERRLLVHYENTGLEFNAARQKMADIPETAELIDNPLSAAPGFVIKNVYVLPGVPKILQAMFEQLSDRLPGGTSMTRITIQCQTGEGNIAEILRDVEARYSGISVGSYPWMKPGQFGTAVVVSGLSHDVTRAAARALETEINGANFVAKMIE
mgnify:CR=1 FL=1